MKAYVTLLALLPIAGVAGCMLDRESLADSRLIRIEPDAKVDEEFVYISVQDGGTRKAYAIRPNAHDTVQSVVDQVPSLPLRDCYSIPEPYVITATRPKPDGTVERIRSRCELASTERDDAILRPGDRIEVMTMSAVTHVRVFAPLERILGIPLWDW
jgi:hypothetical protein